jgi:hypothetical protein
MMTDASAGVGTDSTGFPKRMLCDLVVQGESRPIGVTPRHPLWSVDRNDWVAVSELQVGERLLALAGSTPLVEAVSLRLRAEPVYNIEVEGHHCYRVGQQGLLVHNASLIGDYTKHNADKSNRTVINRCNVAEYLKQYKGSHPTIQIGAGPNPSHVSGALPEDHGYYSGDTLLWLEMNEPISKFLLASEKFDDAIVINVLISGGKKIQAGPYDFIFKLAAPVLKSGGVLQLVGRTNAHQSILWAIANLGTIKNLGFVVSPDFEPPIMEADPDLKALPSFRLVNGATLPISVSQPNAVQIFFIRQG